VHDEQAAWHTDDENRRDISVSRPRPARGAVPTERCDDGVDKSAMCVVRKRLAALEQRVARQPMRECPCVGVLPRPEFGEVVMRHDPVFEHPPRAPSRRATPPSVSLSHTQAAHRLRSAPAIPDASATAVRVPAAPERARRAPPLLRRRGRVAAAPAISANACAAQSLSLRSSAQGLQWERLSDRRERRRNAVEPG
jgi:hypothetical protein